MEMMEVALLIIGVVIIVVSFLIPSSKEGSTVSREMAQGEIRNLIAEEMNRIKQQVDDVVDESITYAIEKTERSLERISNEKIMAVSEYSDTVLSEIHKNHQEVMFLYDMLNDKHISLKQTVNVVEKKAKEAEAIASGAFKTLQPEVVIPVEEVRTQAEPEEKKIRVPVFERMSVDEVEAVNVSNGNRNEAILGLYKKGMDRLQIARELGLGVGEVDLVIGLFKERKL